MEFMSQFETIKDFAFHRMLDRSVSVELLMNWFEFSKEEAQKAYDEQTETLSKLWPTVRLIRSKRWHENV